MVRPPAPKTPANPTDVDPDYEQRVRDRAYHLWEAEGKPHGRDVEFWERARALEAAEESAAPEPPPVTEAKSPVAEAKSKAPPKKAAEAASIQASMAEAPGIAAEAGDMKPDAAPKKARAKPKKPA